MEAALLAAVLLGAVQVDGTAWLEGRPARWWRGEPTPNSGLAALALSIQDGERGTAASR